MIESSQRDRRRTFASLRVRNFRLFFAGQLVSQVGNWLTSIALTLLVLHRTHSGLAIGVLGACQFGPILLLGPWAGLIAVNGTLYGTTVAGGISGNGTVFAIDPDTGAETVLPFLRLRHGRRDPFRRSDRCERLAVRNNRRGRQ